MSLHCSLYRSVITGDKWHPEILEEETRLSELNLGHQEGDRNFLLNCLLANEVEETMDRWDQTFRPSDTTLCREWVTEHLDGWSKSNWLKVLDLMEEDPTVFISISW